MGISITSLLEKGHVVKSDPAAGGPEAARKYYEQSLEHYQRCQDHAVARHAAAVKEAEVWLAKKLDTIRAAADNQTRTEQLADEYFKLAGRRFGIKPGASTGVYKDRTARALQDSLTKLRSPGNAAKQEVLLRLVVSRLAQGYGVLKGILQARIITARQAHIDPNNVYGLARAHHALGQYAQAVKYYNQLAVGIDKDRQPGLFWKAQIGACECTLKAFKDNNDRMKTLLLRIRQLKSLYWSELERSSILDRLNAIQREAKALIGVRRDRSFHLLCDRSILKPTAAA